MPRSDSYDPPLPDIVGNAPAMREVYRLTRLAAPTSASVLLIGETGTGKEVIARAIHRLSPRSDGPYIRVNCGALHENLLESALFGHIKGAFTGAVDNKTGLFEAAHGGSIFLDEISSTTPQLQVKLLRVLQEREFERVGDTRTIRVDVRVIAATNQALEDEIEAGNFREDLYYRLNVIPIPLPALRERREDIPLLAQFFLQRYCEQNQRPVMELAPDVLAQLEIHEWKGNVRELENTIERLVVLSEGSEISLELVKKLGRQRYQLRSLRGGEDVPSLIQRLVQAGLRSSPSEVRDLHKHLVGGLERVLIEEVMKQCDGFKVKAAARLGINRNTLHKKLEDYEKKDGYRSSEEPTEESPEPEEP